jgi:hypothetical protein
VSTWAPGQRVFYCQEPRWAHDAEDCAVPYPSDRGTYIGDGVIVWDTGEDDRVLPDGELTPYVHRDRASERWTQRALAVPLPVLP